MHSYIVKYNNYLKQGKETEANNICEKLNLEANKSLKNVEEWPEFLSKPELPTFWEALQGKSTGQNIDLKLPKIFYNYQNKISKSVVDGGFVEKLKPLRDPRDTKNKNKMWDVNSWKNLSQNKTSKVLMF